MPTPVQRMVFAVLACVAYVAEARAHKDIEVKLETPQDYLWAVLKVSLAFSPIIVIGAVLGCAKEDKEAEAAKTAASKESSCKT
eukprot:g3457.t1